ncbi:unnamed protein product [Urochloa decumbens]|uniref:DUF1618 domain-containing protein n=1 Tax=Urochloa decumbens TaxID=240449 RepID=A0ABC9AYV7_9POAL
MPATAEPSSSRRHRRPRRGSRRPARVLLDTEAVIGIHSSTTTAAEDRTRNEMPIRVSFLLRRPPHPSTLFVHSSDLNPSVAPDILCSADDLLLLGVNMVRSPLPPCGKDYDFFFYRADPSRPSLHLLRRPHPHLSCYGGVGLHPRPGGNYTVAALNFTGWISRTLSVEAPQEDFPVRIPRNCGRIFHHRTTAAVTIGGEGGTMGWADLWRGVLLCDVLDPKPSLRGVPLPLPLVEMGYNNVWGMELGNPAQRRGIAFVRDKGCLKFVHLEITEKYVQEIDEVTGLTSVRVDDWALTTWSNTKMSSSMEDWHKESVVRASGIAIDPAVSRVLEDTGLLLRGRRPDDEERRDLQNLSMYQPSPCISVVYLVAREKFSHPRAWVLAVDMKNGGRLQSAAYFGIRRYHGVDVIYCPSRISKYMNPAKYEKPATTPLGQDAEESNEDGEVELIKIPDRGGLY